MMLPEESAVTHAMLETAPEPPAKSVALAAETGGRIPELDGLRGMAIALVMAFHYFYFAPGPDYHAAGVSHHMYLWFERFVAVGWTGVDLFFVLSGFLIGGILLDVRQSPRYYRTFYLRRLFRIMPPYYAWIVAYVVVMAVAGSFLSAHTVGGNVAGRGPYLLMQFLFLQNVGVLNGYSVISGPWFWPTWSLAVEEQFYLIVPAVVRLLSRRALYVALGTSIVSAPLLRLLIYYHFPAQRSGLGMALTLMPCRADALGIGILAALLWRDSGFRSWLSDHGHVPYGLTVFFCAGFVALGKWSPAPDSLPMQSVGYTWIAIFCVLILLLALAKPAGPIAWLARRAWLRELGRVSYCLYLIHYGLLMACHGIVDSLVAHVKSWEVIGMSGAAAVMSYLVARASWVYFEHPLVKRGHAFKY